MSLDATPRRETTLDLTGLRLGTWVVLRWAGYMTGKNAAWWVACRACGAEKPNPVLASHLCCGRSMTCKGCGRRRLSSEREEAELERRRQAVGRRDSPAARARARRDLARAEARMARLKADVATTRERIARLRLAST